MSKTKEENTLDQMKLDMLNQIPVGMGIYRIENGIPSLVFLNDSYYEIMGFTREDRTIYLGVNTIQAVHPDDRQSIMDGIQTVLSGKVHHYRVVVRMVLKTSDTYHWVQMEGRVAKKEGDVIYMYVSFTKIDDLKKTQNELIKAKTELEKTQAWLQAAMLSAGIQYFEYFPHKHCSVGYQDDNPYDIPKVLKNYPECLFEMHLAHPEDEDSFRSFWDTVHSGVSPVTWEGRFQVGEGKYNWFRVISTKINDPKEDIVFSCTMTDITLEKEAEESYRNHLDSVLRSNPEAIASFRMNATKNICYNGVSQYDNILNLKNSGTVDGFLMDAQKLIPDEDGKKAVYEAFNRSSIIRTFRQGKTRISVEHRFQLSPDHTEWITTLADLVKNPVTGDIEGILYTLNTNTRRMERTVLQGILSRWYETVSVVDVETDEFFLFEKSSNTHGKHFPHFFQNHDSVVRSHLTEEEWNRLSPKLCANTVKHMLAANGSYSVNFFCETEEGLRRRQVSYSYSDDSRRTLISSLRDFSDLDLLEKFRYSSEHDPITHLYNRQKTFSQCRRMLDEHPDESFYLCHMDIQRFHLINSFYGEANGNALLHAIGQQLSKHAHDFPYSVYGRIVADVFCFCIPARKDILERDVKAVRNWLKEYGTDFLIEANFGAYEIQDRSMSIEAMFTRATMAAKDSRNSLLYHHSYYDPSMEALLLKEQQITNDMHTALLQEQFQVYIQPKYVLASSRPCGGEALVRWKHPTKGMISPGDFIPLFEKNGFILQLDQYMWEHVCKILRGWLDAGLHPDPISVNVSRVSMYSPSTATFLHDLMEKYQLPHHLMQLELTESAYMNDPEEIKRRLLQLQEDGFIILMDDFGSGYSSLNTLRELPVDYLKVDMRFLSAENDNHRSRLILASVIYMAYQLNLPVITEGVETSDQKEFLHQIGCTYAQGYLFARPMPVQEYELLMQQADRVEE